MSEPERVIPDSSAGDRPVDPTANPSPAQDGSTSAPGRRERWVTISIVVAALVLSAIEYAAYRWQGVRIIIAARVWIGWSALVVLASAGFTLRALWGDLKARHWMSFAALAVALICVGWGMGRPQDAYISNEAALQVGSGLLNSAKA